MGIIDSLYIKRTCPSCINEFYPGDCEIVSTVGPGKVLKSAPKGSKRLLSRINPEPLDSRYILDLARRKCPHCGYFLPPNIELVDNINIAIVGDTFSGKSHYIAALIHQIQQGDLQRADRYARFDCITQDIERDYIRDVIKPLFNDKQSPSPTQMATNTNRSPLIYELIFSPSPEYPSKRINLILYDASGEDLAIKERMVQFSRYVLNANAIIFLVDPVSIPAIFNLLPQFLQKQPATGRSNSSVLNSLIALLERYSRVTAGSSLSSTPIAITLTKSDLLKYLVTMQEQYSFLKRPVYNGTVNIQDMATVDSEVRQLLAEYGERTLLQSTNIFAKVRFFATSATGYAPDERGIYLAVDPCRCLDPVLWILYELDILNAA